MKNKAYRASLARSARAKVAKSTSHIHLHPINTQAQRGFTLVELVVIILLLSVLSLVALPRFTGSSGFTEYGMQKRLVAALRNLQLKAIYDTRPSFCYKMLFDTSSSPEFGPSTASYLGGSEATSCGNAIDYNSQSYTRSELGEIAASGLSFSTLDASTPISYIEFDNIGRARTSAGSCAANCTFSFSGESTVNVCVSGEGYIYAC